MIFTEEQFDCLIVLMRAAAAREINHENRSILSFEYLVVHAKSLFVEPTPPPAPAIEPEAQRALDDGRKLQAKIDEWAMSASDNFFNRNASALIEVTHHERALLRSAIFQFAKECRACGDGGAFERDQEVKP